MTPRQDPPGVDLVAVLVLLVAAVAFGLFIGWHAAAYGTVAVRP